MSSALVLMLLLAAPPSDHPPPPKPTLRLELLGSPTFGMEAGVRSMRSVQQLAFLHDAWLSDWLDFDERGPWRRTLAIAGRSLKWALVDAPIVLFLDTVTHEVFGHGARARESGQWPSYGFSLPFPYRLVFQPRANFSGTAYLERIGIPDADLPFTFGGLEAGTTLVHFRALENLRDGRAHFSDATAVVLTRLGYVERLVSSQPLGSKLDGSDPDHYAVELAARFNLGGSAPLLDVGQRLKRAWALSFIDPYFWLSSWNLFVGHLGRGERVAELPMLRVGGVGLFPLTRFAFGPFGAEHTLDVVAVAPDFALDVSFRFVSTGFAPAFGLGARLFRWRPFDTLELGGQVESWLQPEWLPEHRNAFDGRLLAGASVMAEVTWHPWMHVGFTAQLGLKSRGHVMSQPLREGPFGFAGVVLGPWAQ